MTKLAFELVGLTHDENIEVARLLGDLGIQNPKQMDMEDLYDFQAMLRVEIGHSFRFQRIVRAVSDAAGLGE